MRAEKDNLVNGADDGVVTPENAVGEHRRSDEAVTGTEAGEVASRADKSGEAVAEEDQASSGATRSSFGGQVFKSTEIYKSESQKGGDVFGEEKTRREKFLNWAKIHKKLCLLIGAGIVAIIAVIIALIVVIANSTQKEGEDTTNTEAVVETTLPDPDIDIIAKGSDADEDSSGSGYTAAVEEVMDYYEDDRNQAREFIDRSVQEALLSGDGTAAQQIVSAEAWRLTTDGYGQEANDLLKGLDLEAFTQEERLRIANDGMNITLEWEDQTEYEYWIEIYNQNVEGVEGYGG